MKKPFAVRGEAFELPRGRRCLSRPRASALMGSSRLGLERALGLTLARGIGACTCACAWLDTDAGGEDDGERDANEGGGGLAGWRGAGGHDAGGGGGGIGREGEGGTILCGDAGTAGASHAGGLRSLRARALASESLLLPAPWLLRRLLPPLALPPSRSAQSGARSCRAGSGSCGGRASLGGRWYVACPLWVRRTCAWAALLLCADGGAPLVVCGRRAVPVGVLERGVRGTGDSFAL